MSFAFPGSDITGKMEHLLINSFARKDVYWKDVYFANTCASKIVTVISINEDWCWSYDILQPIEWFFHSLYQRRLGDLFEGVLAGAWNFNEIRNKPSVTPS